MHFEVPSLIRLYEKHDQERLVQLFRLNSPEFFAESEEEDFIDYLSMDSQHYYVVEEPMGIVGAGGINYGFDSGKTARISWDIVHPESQGKGIGTELTQFRITQIKQSPQIKKIVVRTSQFVYDFYRKNGFELERTEKDFWAEGYDLVEMKMDLA